MPTKRATEAFGSRDNTEYFLSGEATTLNTSWMEQSPRHPLAALEKMVVQQTARH